jgi:hypothetical protein
LPSKSFFDAVWPEENSLAPAAADPAPVHSAPEPPAAPAETQRAAVLKSGVIGGMGYKLYLDGSIEAELPQGTSSSAS